MVNEEEKVRSSNFLLWPTETEESEVWESLGRLVATFGFLEITLKGIIFDLRYKKELGYEKDFDFSKLEDGIPKRLSEMLSSPLGNLIPEFKNVMEEKGKIKGLDRLLECLENIKIQRDTICHGFARGGYNNFTSFLIMNKKGSLHTGKVDKSWIDRLRIKTMMIIVDIQKLFFSRSANYLHIDEVLGSMILICVMKKLEKEP